MRTAMSRLRLAAPALTFLIASFVFIGALTGFGCKDGNYAGAALFGVFIVPPVTGFLAGLVASRVYEERRVEATVVAFLGGLALALGAFVLLWVLTPLSDCAGT